MSFEIKISLFEGPFDLLLFFIKRDELDIHDIPIAKITNDFLAYTHDLEKLNMEVASEFILVAATLMRIKAKMLLPRVEVDEEGNEIDPREELVQHLLAYKKYKSVIGELEKLEEEMMQRNKRGNVAKEVKKLMSTTDVEAELQSVDLYKLLTVYQQILKEQELEKTRPIHQVVPYPYNISEQRSFIIEKLRQHQKLSFQQIITYAPNRIAVIFNFLAILELMQLRLIEIQLGEGYNNFWIVANEDTASVDASTIVTEEG